MLSCKPYKAELPVISFFDANPPGISIGGSSALSWIKCYLCDYSPVQTMSFGSASTQSATTGWSLNADGAYWVRVRTITPNEVLSNRSTWTIDCK